MATRSYFWDINIAYIDKVLNIYTQGQRLKTANRRKTFMTTEMTQIWVLIIS